MYAFLDKFFFVFHSALIAFNLFGWIWRKTRVAHLAVVLLTASSWTILGIWYGFGFCPSTAWHWQVREKLGHHDLPSSYIKFLVDSLTGLNMSESFVNISAVLFLTLVLFASVVTNIKDWRKKH